MGFDPCEHDKCDWKDYSRKTAHHPMPKFTFPVLTPPTTVQPETTTIEHITKIVRDIITSDAPMTSTESTTVTSSENILNATFTEMVGLQPNTTFNETTSTNNTIMFGISESTTSSSVIELMQNGSLPLNETDAGGGNNAMLTTLSEFGANTESILSTTTERVVSAVTEIITKMSSSTEGSKDDRHTLPHHSHVDSHHWLYIILIIIIAILVLIGIILLLIYIRYRKNSSKMLQNYYNVSPMKERSSSTYEQEEQKEYPPEVFMQYPC